MDTNQPTSGSPDGQHKQEVHPQAPPKMEFKIPNIPNKPSMSSLPKLSLPKVPMPNIPTGKVGTYIINKLREYDRVLKITKKPSLDEYKMTAKATGLGIVIIGTIGFIITMVVQLLGLI